jgi:hypothetical protein
MDSISFPRVEELTVCRKERQQQLTTARTKKGGKKAAHLCFFKITGIILLIRRKLLRRVDLYRDIGGSLKVTRENVRPLSYASEREKDALNPERTRIPTDVDDVGKSLMERDMSVGADPADRILFRALRVANKEFVYTIMYRWVTTN